MEKTAPAAQPKWVALIAKRKRRDHDMRSVSNRNIAMRAVKMWGRK